MAEVERFPNPGPRTLGAVVQNVVAAVRPSYLQMAKYHSHAEEFHAALYRANMAQDEIDSLERDLKSPFHKDSQDEIRADLKEQQQTLAEAYGAAMVALQKMPCKWAAILGDEMPAPTEAA